MVDNKRIQLKEMIIELYHTISSTQIDKFLEGEGAVLMYLYHTENGEYPSRLSTFLDVSRARITSIINALKIKEFVEINSNDDDRRKVKVIITDKGRTYLENKRRVFDKLFNELLMGISDEDIDEVIQSIHYLTGVFENMEEVIENDEQN